MFVFVFQIYESPHISSYTCFHENFSITNNRPEKLIGWATLRSHPVQDRESQIEGLEPKGDSPPKLDAGIIEFKDRLDVWVSGVERDRWYLGGFLGFDYSENVFFLKDFGVYR